MRKMIRDPEVSKILVSIHSYPDYSPSWQQWARTDDTLVFFGQTFGSWVMMFFKPEEIQELIK